MKKTVVCLLLVAFCGFSYAGDTINGKNKSKRESVEELLIVTHADSLIDAMYAQMDPIAKDMVKQLRVKPSEKEIFDKVTERMFSLMKTEICWAKMKEPMIQIYMKHFSEKEVQDMITFYKSDTGQSVIRKMPEIIHESMLLSQKFLKDLLPKMQKIEDEFEKELAAKRKSN